MKKIIYLLLLIALLGGTVAAQTEDFSKLRRMFLYDRKMPLDVREIRVENKDGIQVHDISYASPKGGRVTGFLVVPPGKGKFAGLIFMHARPGSRTNFLDEALSYARMGAVSLLIDAPFSRAGESKRDFDPTVKHPEIDRDIYIQTVVDLRRAVDLLLSRRHIDRKRIGFVGYSFGAHTGVLLASVEKRIKGYVIMAGAPSLTEFLRTSQVPGIVEVRNSLTKSQQENYFTTLATVDPINYIAHVAPSALFFEFGKRDTYPTEQSAARYFQVASDPKSVKWYDTGHALNDEARHDRALWLQKQLGLDKLN
jgi:dienelactone hydrolase